MVSVSRGLALAPFIPAQAGIQSEAVMRGLDPRIHLLRKNFLRMGLIAGSSPAMTNLIERPCAFAGTNGAERKPESHDGDSSAACSSAASMCCIGPEGRS